MNLNTRDTLVKKILDAQESVRDYQSFSKEINDQEVKDTYKQFAEQSAMQAQKLQQLLNKCDGGVND